MPHNQHLQRTVIRLCALLGRATSLCAFAALHREAYRHWTAALCNQSPLRIKVNNAIRVGVGVFIIRNRKVLLGERAGAHGAGTWALPGGQLEMGESLENCVRREVLEETGLELTSIRKCGFTNDIFEDGRMHCVTLYVTALCPEGEAENREPDYCKQWKWFEFNNLPQPLFLPLRDFLNDAANFRALVRAGF